MGWWCCRKLDTKGKVYFLLNLSLKFNYVVLIHNKLMATYRLHIRCNHIVSAEQKFPWKKATSFTGELLCSVPLSFDRLQPVIAQGCQDEGLDWQRCQHSPSTREGCKGPFLAQWSHDVSQPFGFPVHMVAARLSGAISSHKHFIWCFQKQLTLTGFQDMAKCLEAVSP